MSEIIGRPMMDLDSKAIEARLHELIGPSISMNDVESMSRAHRAHISALWILHQQNALLSHFPWVH